MDGINERIRYYRDKFHLSQEYVSKYLGINRSTYSQMENGRRKITADEIAMLSRLFGISSDALIDSVDYNNPTMVFARSFEKLSKDDQAEIMNLIRFKEKMKMQRD